MTGPVCCWRRCSRLAVFRPTRWRLSSLDWDGGDWNSATLTCQQYSAKTVCSCIFFYNEIFNIKMTKVLKCQKKLSYSKNSLRPFSLNDPLSGENFTFLVFTMAIAWSTEITMTRHQFTSISGNWNGPVHANSCQLRSATCRCLPADAHGIPHRHSARFHV